MPDVALLVPCYNAAAFLSRFTKSFREVRGRFSQVLCYDDGSVDDTVAVARRLGLDILTGNRNRGVSHARNELSRAVAAEWIHFHDPDDLIAPGFLERLLPHCTAEFGVVSCDADWVDALSRSLIIAWRYDAQALANDPYRHLLTHPLSLNNSIIRRDAWLDIGGCDESLAMWEDADVHARLARAGARFCHVGEVLTTALRRGESFSHDYRRNWLCRATILERYARHPTAPRVADVLAIETEKAAASLVDFGEFGAARQMLQLSRELGGDPPATGNRLLQLLKCFGSPFLALRLQRWLRRRAAAGAARR